MKNLYLLLMCFGFVSSYSQTCPSPVADCSTGNMVFNGSFETFSALPTLFNQVNRACGWQSANNATPDYYHASSPEPDVQVPCNFWGYQNASSGQAYIGLVSRYFGETGEGDTEIVYTQLVQPLLANTDYQLSFKAALADGGSGYAASVEAFLGTSVVSVGSSNWWDGSLIASGTFLNGGAPITSTDWTTVTFNFNSGSGGQAYLYIGRMSQMLFTDLTPVNSPVNGCSFAPPEYIGPYWYIDDIVLTRISNPPPMQLPKFICEGTILPDLTQFIGGEPDNGVFEGDGVSESGGIYSFDSSVTGPGEFVITYTYTDALGCESMVMIGSITVISSESEQCGCANTLTLTTAQVTTPELIQRHEWIKANDGYSISGAKDITMRAGDYIELNPVTSYETTQQFTAEIIDCCESCKKPNEKDKADDSLANRFHIQPNPATHQLEILLDNQAIGSVVVISFDGRIVASHQNIGQKQFLLDVSRFVQGVYIINVSSDDGNLYSEKFIKN